MLQRFKNFFLHGMLGTDEQLGIRNPLKERMKEMEANEEKRKEQPPIVLDKDDRKALFIAAVQVIGPMILVLIGIVFLMIFLTAKFFT